ADANGNVSESNENNNVVSKYITVNSAKPDLIIKNQLAASSVTAGSTLKITYSLKNQGSANASANYTKFYLSTDATYSSNDIQLGSDYISSVSTGITKIRDKYLSISSNIAAGNYYLLWRADANGNVSESNENNNVVSKYITVNSAKPDLIIKNQLAASSVTAGSTLKITYSLKNQGSANASANYTKFYLSTDATYSSNDIQLGSDYISSVSTGITKIRDKYLSIGSNIAAGNYYLLWKADANGNVSESNENNNVVSKAITVNSTSSQLVSISNLSFSGNEGDFGTFKIKLNRAISSTTTLIFDPGSFLTVDSDNIISNGTQTSIVFNSANWNVERTVRFIAENDASSSNRISGNTINYSLSGGLTGSGSYSLGTIRNTYAPDNTKFNIDLDFRNDYLGFWTESRRNIAQRAANDWSRRITNELSTWSSTDIKNGQVGANGQSEFSFIFNRVVDDLIVFVGAYTGGDKAGGWGGSSIGGWTTSDPLPRVGTFTINTSSNVPNSYASIYSLVSHELGHVLGLIGQNRTSYNLINKQTKQFGGEYTRLANGGNYMYLQASGGPNPVTGRYDYSHPANSVVSMMSYGHTYRLSAPTEIDYAMLADSGYRISGINSNTSTTASQDTSNSGELMTSVSTFYSPDTMTGDSVNEDPIIREYATRSCGCFICSASSNTGLNYVGSTSLTDLITG
ncbi:MAG: hypothetical protein F6K41_19500, partial [Symploca sp. SIO3E6]|nr:hypothetical protein [Caldora sp. SIO3E6]